MEILIIAILAILGCMWLIWKLGTGLGERLAEKAIEEAHTAKDMHDVAENVARLDDAAIRERLRRQAKH